MLVWLKSITQMIENLETLLVYLDLDEKGVKFDAYQSFEHESLRKVKARWLKLNIMLSILGVLLRSDARRMRDIYTSKETIYLEMVASPV